MQVKNIPNKKIDFDPPTPTKAVGWKWRPKDPRVMKFIDDGMMCSKINMMTCQKTTSNGVTQHTKHDVQTQNVFRNTIMRGQRKGMKVNVSKTKLLLISTACSYSPPAYIETLEGERLCSTRDEIKMLGFAFYGSTNAGAHVRATVSKARRRLWILRPLIRFGFSQQELVKIYKSMIRSVVEYCSTVFHFLLTEEESDTLERCQYQALKCTYGFGKSYRCWGRE